jgi:two-component sensor histidine kinase
MVKLPMSKFQPVIAVNNDKADATPEQRSISQVEGGSEFNTAGVDKRIHILIVDDEPKNLAVLEAILNDPSYCLVRAGSAEEALLALLAQEFALLILDIRMPGITGLELAQMIKDRKKTAQVPIIFLTAYYNEDQHVLDGYGSGAIDYLHKPVSAPVLRAKVAIFAELHRRQREAESANRALVAEVTSRRLAEEQLRELNNTLEQQISERTQDVRVLLNEVSHRSKNILSLVIAMAQQTAASKSNDFLRIFTKRVQALAANHDLLLQNSWRSIGLEQLVRAQLALFEGLIGNRISIGGSPLFVNAKASQAIGIALHELATNAAKYGSLSTQTGSVEISWQVEHPQDGEANFLLCWSERGGPPAVSPMRSGFGTRVIKDMVELSLDANVTLDYAVSGLVWRLNCPAPNVLGTEGCA